MARVAFLLVLIASFLSSLSAFQSSTRLAPSRASATAIQSISRKEMLASAIATVALTSGSTMVLADEYDDARKAAREKSKGGGGGASLMAVPLVGGLALSLPFFLPNIMRLLGIKNTKMDE